MLASLSLDLDDLWSYLKTHGDPEWERRPSYLPMVVPRLLDLLDEASVKITFFLVGADAEREENGAVLRAIVERGHDVANHSFNHDPWLHRYSESALDQDLDRAETAILRATGQRPTGFRGPGFSWSPTLLAALERRGYRYDASTLPTFLGPLARWYFLASSPLKGQERAKRAGLFGGFRDGWRSAKPYRWRWNDRRSLLELPVTTLPVLKLPFHLSYLIYLAGYSETAMKAYLGVAIRSCRLAGFGPSFLLHPLDLLDQSEVPSLAFFPGMGVPVARKRRLFLDALGTLSRNFQVVTMDEHADAFDGEQLPFESPVQTAGPRSPSTGGRPTAGHEVF